MSTESTLTKDVVARLQAAIERREYPEGIQLPSERELAEKFGVSRVTIRRALKELEATGFVHRRGTIGTFVSPELNWLPGPAGSGPVPPVATDLTAPWYDKDAPPRSGLSREYAAANRIVDVGTPELIEPNEYVARKLVLRPDALAVRRLRLVLDVGLSVYEFWDTYYPWRVFMDELPSVADPHALDRWLREHYGDQRKRVVVNAQVRVPTTQEAFWLRISRATPMVDLERLVYDQQGAPIELSRVATAAAHYRFGREYEEKGFQPRVYFDGPSS